MPIQDIINLPARERRLPKVFKQKWLTALRSGDYEQGEGFLYAGGKYCCLGVACETLGVSTTEVTLPWELEEKGRLPKLLLKDSFNDDEYLTLVGALADLNDTDGFTFEQIADVIERYC